MTRDGMNEGLLCLATVAAALYGFGLVWLAFGGGA